MAPPDGGADGGDAGGPYTATQIGEGEALLLCIRGACTTAPDGGADGGEAGAPACTLQ
jgi:hypothetical protein